MESTVWLLQSPSQRLTARDETGAAASTNQGWADDRSEPHGRRHARERDTLRVQSQLGVVVRELRRNRGAVIGLVLIVFLVLVAIFAPLIAPYDPIAVNPDDSLAGVSARHLIGSDTYGRDVFSRVLYGARISLVIGLLSVGIGAAIGVPVGLIAGWWGGWLRALIMRCTDAMLALPGILLALTIIAVLDPAS